MVVGINKTGITNNYLILIEGNGSAEVLGLMFHVGDTRYEDVRVLGEWIIMWRSWSRIVSRSTYQCLMGITTKKHRFRLTDVVGVLIIR
ncbi:hypothetical protein [Candidatus Hodgkinia cicadicola]|uniref:hypothetical protein n=1 Tax=Candidatus Hodgkinia cicadicola TaxID=573658 RepID=UPI0011BA8566